MSSECERALRKVLSEQLRLTTLNYDDNLILVDPDFPTDEVLRDALEELGFQRKYPSYSKWSGTLKDLIAILESNCRNLADTKQRLEQEKLKNVVTESGPSELEK